MYFTLINVNTILILNGRNKSTQNKDIKNAIKYINNYNEDNHEKMC